jgi:poly-gamma-glutamate synthesis protein (capsule biosynthesis protein)
MRSSALSPAVILVLQAGCDPYAHWPDPQAVFPWVSSPEEGLEPWEEVRYEAGGWTPGVDLTETALYLQKALATTDRAPPETPVHFGLHRSGLPAVVEIDRVLAFSGDAMWTGAGWADTYGPSARLLDGADLRLTNLETPTDPDQPTDAAALGLYAFNADPSLLDGLPADVVQLSNNHATDAGADGLDATIDQIEARGLTVAGVDAHPVLDVAGATVAVLAYTWGLNGAAPVDHDLHVLPFCDLDARLDLDGVAADIEEANADLVVVLVHWGFEYEHFPAPRMMRVARRLVALGADAVVGTGPHVPQPAEFCFVNTPGVVPGTGTCSVRSADGTPRTAAILYSLGNFGTATGLLPATQAGLVARLSLDPERGATGMDWAAVASLPDGGGQTLVPLLDLLDDPVWAEEDARLVAHLGPRWRR